VHGPKNAGAARDKTRPGLAGAQNQKQSSPVRLGLENNDVTYDVGITAVRSLLVLGSGQVP